MDDQYNMIEQNIDSLLEESFQYATTPTNQSPVTTTRRQSFLPYKCLETAVLEGPILGQYMKWSTVESDELNVRNDSQAEPFVAHTMPTDNYATVERVMQNMLWNLWNAQVRQTTMTTTKRTCSYCKKSGMSFAVYSSHALRVNGVLQCPNLLGSQCNYCLQSGHTTGYCPMKGRAATTTANASPFFQNNALNRY